MQVMVCELLRSRYEGLTLDSVLFACILGSHASSAEYSPQQLIILKLLGLVFPRHFLCLKQ